MSPSKEQGQILLVIVHFTVKKRHHLWYPQANKSSNVLAVENEEMSSHLCKK